MQKVTEKSDESESTVVGMNSTFEQMNSTDEIFEKVIFNKELMESMENLDDNHLIFKMQNN